MVRFVTMAVLAVVGFALAFSLELWIDRIASQNVSLIAETEALQRLLAEAPTFEKARFVQGRMAALHLSGNQTTQTVIVLEELQRIAQRRNLRLTVLRRQTEARPGSSGSPRLPHTLYETILQGEYRMALAALGDLADASLVARAQAVTLERVQRITGSTDVRMSLELAVYRMEPANVRAHSS